MEQQLAAAGAQPCVWMCAGLISYRLCNRDFDCEHCPLDAALRGELRPRLGGSALLYRPEHHAALPADRHYTTGHTWAQRVTEHPRVWRLGIDSFAATLLGTVREVKCEPFEHLQTRDPVCLIDVGLGVLSIGTPLNGRVLSHNEELDTAPDLLVTACYTDGWTAELLADDAPPATLLEADAAHRQLTLDLRRFRRNIAFRLLAAGATGELREGELEDLNDLRHVIAGEHYVDCIRDFIH